MLVMKKIITTTLATLFFFSNEYDEKMKQEAIELCKTKGGGFHKYEKDCGKYLWCFFDNAFIMPCPAGKEFSVELSLCTFPQEAKCEPISPTNIPINNITNEDNSSTIDFNKIEESQASKNDNDDSSSSSSNNNNNNNNNTNSNEVIINDNNSRGQLYNAHNSSNACKKIVCYTPGWAQNRLKLDKYFPKYIDAFLCTHVIYSFANISNGKIHFTEKNDDTLIKELMEKKKTYPDLKILISVGDWNVGSHSFTTVVATTSYRRTFIANVMEFLRKYDFEGLDLNLMYPPQRTSPIVDKQLISYLIQELRCTFNNEVIPSGKSKLLLTATVTESIDIAKIAYEAKELDTKLDFINLKTFDYSWEGHANNHGTIRLLKETAEYWVNSLGASRNKIIIGMPFYARTFTLHNRNSNSYGAPATKPGLPGPYSHQLGLLSYYEVCDMLIQPMTTKIIHEGEFPYCTIGDQWIGYDDEASLNRKVKYVLDGKFGGVMINDLSFDDFRGSFCGRGKYPLLKAINEACFA